MHERRLLIGFLALANLAPATALISAFR